MSNATKREEKILNILIYNYLTTKTRDLSIDNLRISMTAPLFHKYDVYSSSVRSILVLR